MFAMLRRLAFRAALLTLLVAAFASTVVTVSAPAASAATGGVQLSSYDAQLLAAINRARAAHHLMPLRIAAGTTTVARRWTCHMAGEATLGHRPDLHRALVRHGSAGAQVLGENVAVTGQSAASLFRAYMRSPEHRANILEPRYRYVGVSTKTSHTARWNTLDFVSSYKGATTVAAC